MLSQKVLEVHHSVLQLTMPPASSSSSPSLSRTSSCTSLSHPPHHPHHHPPFLDLHASPAAVVAGIQRPPLPKGSLEFQTLMDEFWPREAESACTTPRQGSQKAKAENRSATPQRLLGPGPGGAGSGHRVSMAHRRGRARLDTVSLVLCKKRILKFVERKRSELKDSCTTTQS